MSDPMVYAFLFLALGLGLGVVLGWLITRNQVRSQTLDRAEVEASYVARPIFQDLQQQADIMRDDLMEKEQEIRELAMSLSAKDQTILHLDDKLREQKKDLEALQERSRLEFEQLANRLLEEKSRRFAHQNQEQIGHLLSQIRFTDTAEPQHSTHKHP